MDSCRAETAPGVGGRTQVEAAIGEQLLHRHRVADNSELYVFGYGSLVSHESVTRTLGHEVRAEQIEPAHLAGWERAWNVGSDKESHPERTFYRRDPRSTGRRGPVLHGVTVVLGLTPSDRSAGCYGAVLPVLRQDLDLLDIRERNYERIDVTEGVTWWGKPEQCVVYTYVPTDEARRKVEKPGGRRLVIRQEYIDLVAHAFESIPELRPHQGLPPYPETTQVISLESVVDVGPARRAPPHPEGLAGPELDAHQGAGQRAGRPPERRDPGMAKLIADLFVSADGFAAGENVEAFFGYAGPDLDAWIATQLATPWTTLMGRVTYESMAAMAGPDGGMDDIAKAVYSNTLTEPLTWKNTTLVRGDPADAVRALPTPVRIIGSLTLVRGLMALGLVDRLRLLVFPVTLGADGRAPVSAVFGRTRLDLVETTVLDARLVLLTYRPVPAAG